MDLSSLPLDYFISSNQFTKTVHTDVYPSIDPTSPPLSQAGKVVIITGAGRGLGRMVSCAPHQLTFLTSLVLSRVILVDPCLLPLFWSLFSFIRLFQSLYLSQPAESVAFRHFAPAHLLPRLKAGVGFGARSLPSNTRIQTGLRRFLCQSASESARARGARRGAAGRSGAGRSRRRREHRGAGRADGHQ